MTLTEFLLARIADDEAVALALRPESERYPYSDRSLPVTPFEDLGDELRGYLGGPLGEHAARWRPARVLAECEAKRRIVDDYQREYWPDAGSDDELAGAHNAVSPAWVLRVLALPYADHPDYDESWRP